jgi:CheY-like chemotaxis protein
MVIVSLIDMDENGDKILKELKFNYSCIPVLVIGTVNEQYEFNRYFGEEQCHRLTRPITNEEVDEKIKYILVDNEEVISVNYANLENKKKILLVDDDPLQLRMLNDILKDKYDVQMVTSGMKAISVLEKRVPDIIFLDYEMPVCDGKMTLEMIRGIYEFKNIPVVFLTGMADKKHIQSVLELKPAGYLLKSTNTERVLETIEKILGQN